MSTWSSAVQLSLQPKDSERDPNMTRLWLDGCFDGFHYAHANAVRQALYLIPGETNPRILVGVHSDEKILKNKGPTLFNECERYNLIRGCRWVDEVVEDVPYVTQLYIIEKYQIDFVVHGDDVVLDAEGNDCYGMFKEIGKYKECKRTEGISTTSLIGRILRPEEWSLAFADDVRLSHLLDLFVDAIPPPFPKAYYADLTSNATRCEAFRAWPSHKKAVYVSGAWDCFGAGHVELLRRAKECAGDDTFLIVGLWSDEVLSEQPGGHPLLSQLERALAVVQCRYTDGVIISAPKDLPPTLMVSLGIQITVNAQGIAEAGIKHLRVDEPPLQTVANLQSKLLAQLSAYQDRQKRKGG